MQKYLLVCKLSLLDLLEYRFDFLMHTVKYASMVMVMTIVWLAVEREGWVPFDRQATVTYFFLAAMIYSLSNFHTVYIEEDIKDGQLSRFLTKPLSPFLYYLVYEGSRAFFETLTKVIVMVPFLFALGYGFRLDFHSLILFLFFLPLIFIYSFSQFSLISGLTFWINEAWSIRWALTIFIRLMAGFFVPILFFPEAVQKALFYLPFSHLAYTPIQLLQGKLSLETSLTALLILSVWTVLFSGGRYYQWRAGYMKYESNGG